MPTPLPPGPKDTLADIVYPTINDQVEVSQNKTIRARVEILDAADVAEVWALVRHSGTGNTPERDTHARLVQRQDNEAFVEHSGVPGFDPTKTNTLYVWIKKVNGQWDGSILSVQLNDPAQVEDLYSVDARGSLYFAWAGNDYAGPYGEQGDAYRPTVIPTGNFNTVTLSMHGTDDDYWTHYTNPPGTGHVTTAAGENGSQKTSAAYAHDDFNSKYIERKDFAVNRLIAMFGTANAPGSSVTVLDVGLAENKVLSVPSGADRLFLGMHDGYEWNTNYGAVRVKATLANTQTT